MIVVGTVYAMDCAGCTRATRRTRSVACENTKHWQMTARSGGAVAYTELWGVQTWTGSEERLKLPTFLPPTRITCFGSLWRQRRHGGHDQRTLAGCGRPASLGCTRAPLKCASPTLLVTCPFHFRVFSTGHTRRIFGVVSRGE